MGGNDDTPADGEVSVTQRRTIIEQVLTQVTRHKRVAEKTVDGRVVASTPARTNGNGSNGANGKNGNGSGHK
jgi:hypothetical protein